MAEAGPGGLPRRSPLPLLVTLGMLAGLLVGTASADERATTAALPTTETAGATEAAGADKITLELIMSDPDWIGNTAKDPYWADDGDAVYFHRKRVGEQIEDLIRLDLATGEERVIADEERGAVDSPGGRLSRDRRFRVYSRHGDLYLKNLETGALTQFTRTAAAETRPRFMADDRGISFHRGDQVYVRDLETGLEYQSADVRLEEDPDDDKPKDDFLSAHQQRLFDVLKQRKDRREAASERAESEQAADPTRPPLPFYLGEEIEIRQAALSGAGDAMILVVRDAERDPGKKDQMPAWVTDSGYVTSQEVRPKVGTGDGSGERLIYLDLEAHEHRELALSVLPGIAEDPLAELKRQTEETKKAEAASEDGENEEEPADDDEEKDAGDEKDEAADAEPEPRAVRFEEPVAWSPDGLQLAVQAHSVDNKDRWIALVDGDEKSLRPIHRLSNEAWINWIFNDFGWFSDSRRLWFLSEESGYSQLYVYSLDDGETSRLTGGDYVVSGVELSPAEDFFYFTANPTHPGVYDTYRVATGGGAVERMTRLGGRTSSILSPDGELLLVTHSITTRPPELYVQATRAGSQVRQITRHATEGFLSLPWVEPEIVAVPSTHHERPIHSRYYEGEAEAGERGRPAVVFVHGAGYLQNAHQGWSGYFREFMFHTLLTRHGYVVLDMDYRASAGYGADWRTAIYRQMGTPELEDLADGVAWLVAEHGVDPDRVGVYGGSYGGFMTMMALFTAPDLFACGAALRPVTDWAHYNHPYTSNILNVPEVDPEAYRRSSPIEHATGLGKPLLICAPMQDDNVFFQDTVRLAQRLIELEKENWEVAIYPVEPHGFRRPSSWLDEYRRIFKLFETHLEP